MSSAAPDGVTRSAAPGEMQALDVANLLVASVRHGRLAIRRNPTKWASKLRINFRGAVLARPAGVAFLRLVVVAMARVEGGAT